MAVVVQRLAPQDYTSLPAYFTDRDWSMMLDSTQHAQLRTEIVFKRAAALGLKAANEPTSSVLTAMYLIASDTLAVARETHASVKHETLKVVKAQYKRFVADHAAQLTFAGPQKLPSVPAEFQTAFQEGWATVFCDDKPSEAPAVTGLAVQQLASTVPLRSTNMSVRQAPAVATQPSFNPQQQQMMMQNMINAFMQNCMGFRQDNPPIMRRLASRLHTDSLPDIGITYMSQPPCRTVPAITDERQDLPQEAIPESTHTQHSQHIAAVLDAAQTVSSSARMLPLAAQPNQIKQSKSATEVTESLLLCINSNEASKEKNKKKRNEKGEKETISKKKKEKVKSSPVKKMSSSKCSPKQVKAKQSKAKWTVEPPQDLIKKFAEGCSSCRNVKGCTPSCWRKRGF